MRKTIRPHITAPRRTLEQKKKPAQRGPRRVPELQCTDKVDVGGGQLAVGSIVYLTYSTSYAANALVS